MAPSLWPQRRVKQVLRYKQPPSISEHVLVILLPAICLREPTGGEGTLGQRISEELAAPNPESIYLTMVCALVAGVPSLSKQ